MNILLADEDLDACHLFKKALDIVPLFTHLTTVHDGVQLMEYLYENLKNLPHVLFIHINMPLKTGFECLSELKQTEILKDLPVIMFSNSNSPDTVNSLFKNGADIYIRMPDNFADLIQIIHHSLPLATENIFSNGKLKYILNS